MLAVLESTWSRVMPALRERVGAAVFDAWLEDLRPLALERGIVHVEAPSKLARQHVERLYADELAAVLSAEIGTQIGVQIETKPEAFLPHGLDVGPSKPVVDAANRTAFLALSSLIEGRELPSNLFFFHGLAGTGKSFLLRWWRDGTRGRVQHMTGPQLVKAFQASLQERRVAGLRDELCRPRPLILDEIHRISGHSRLQLELARVLQDRRGLRHPTMLASRWHPKDIWRLESKLENWLMSGFVAELQEPTHAGRLQYIRALEGKPSQNGRAAGVEDLARRARGGYEEVRRAWAIQREGGPGAQRYWQLIEPRSVFDRMRDRVATALDVEVDELVGSSQRRRASQARKILAWLCVQEGLSRAEVGRYLSRRTRAAISYSIKSLEKEMGEDPELRRLVEGLQ